MTIVGNGLTTTVIFSVTLWSAVQCNLSCSVQNKKQPLSQETLAYSLIPWYISYIILDGLFRVSSTKFRVIIYIPETKLLLLSMRNQESIGNFQQHSSLLKRFVLSPDNWIFIMDFFLSPRHSFWSEEKLEAKPDQFLIVRVSHIFEQNTDLPSSYTDLLPPIWILRGNEILKSFVKLYSSFPDNTRNYYIYFPSFYLFCLFGLSTWGA